MPVPDDPPRPITGKVRYTSSRRHLPDAEDNPHAPGIGIGLLPHE
jgi:hypothetical protein